MGAIIQEYFSIKELTQYCGLSERTLRTYLKNEALPFYSVGRKILIRRMEFDNWMTKYRGNEDRVTKLVDELLGKSKA